MKKYLFQLSIVLLFLAFGAAGVVAQNKQLGPKEVKALKKTWKKKAKTYVKNPLALKAKEEAFQREVEELTKKLAECQNKYTALQAELDKCESIVRQKNLRFDSLTAEYERLKTAYEASKTVVQKDALPGCYFRVQVGAYEKFNMNQYLETTGETFTGESLDNLNKYMMGKFKSFALATAFKDDIRKLGIKDAWIVAYNDGVRIKIEEAKKILEGGSGGVTPPPTDR